jgi:hypothetical protein
MDRITPEPREVIIPSRLVPYLDEALRTGLYGLTFADVVATLVGQQVGYLVTHRILSHHPVEPVGR